jgi:hypothetical protein
MNKTYFYLSLFEEKNSQLYHLKLVAQWAEPVSLTCHSVLRKLLTEPSMCASYQISINLAKWF